MVKNVLVSITVILLLVLIPVGVYFTNVSTARADQESVIYTLPYPGILPDNPLYILKVIRDRVVEWFTRDNIKKAEFDLLLSDKRAAMAVELAKQGKDKLAIDTFAKGEKYFIKIPNLLKEAKKQGTSPSSDFVSKLKVSNAKHRELLNNLLKDFPQGRIDDVMQVIKINETIQKQLQLL